MTNPGLGNGGGPGRRNGDATTATAEGFEAECEWSRELWTALEPYHQSVYVNFLMDEGEQRVRDAYGGERYDRLRQLKRKYDPDNLFRGNHNVSPSRGGGRLLARDGLGG